MSDAASGLGQRCVRGLAKWRADSVCEKMRRGQEREERETEIGWRGASNSQSAALLDDASVRLSTLRIILVQGSDRLVNVALGMRPIDPDCKSQTQY